MKSGVRLDFPKWDVVQGTTHGMPWSVRWDRHAARNGQQRMIYYGFNPVRMGTKVVNVAIRNVPRDGEWPTGVRLDVDLEQDGFLFGSLPLDHVGGVFSHRDQQTVVLLFGWDALNDLPIIRCYDRCSLDSNCAEVLSRHRLSVNVDAHQSVVTVYSDWDTRLAMRQTLQHKLPVGDVAAMQALVHLLWHAPRRPWWNIGWIYDAPVDAFRDFYTAWSARHLARWSGIVHLPSADDRFAS
jgi:hypothetical protein